MVISERKFWECEQKWQPGVEMGRIMTPRKDRSLTASSYCLLYYI